MVLERRDVSSNRNCQQMPHKTLKIKPEHIEIRTLGGSTEPFPLKEQHWPGYFYLKLEIYAGGLGENKTTKM